MDVTGIFKSSGTTRIILSAQPSRESSTGRERDDADSHDNGPTSFGVVYVNEVARHAMLSEKKPQFPIGSVIVREKLAQDNAAEPQALVLMVKRERGFNPKAKDWEFLLLDGDARTVSRREKTGGCRDCHAQQQKTDFVFRYYLPEDVRLKQQ